MTVYCQIMELAAGRGWDDGSVLSFVLLPFDWVGHAGDDAVPSMRKMHPG